MGRGDSYYWAGGQRIPLTRTEEVVVDLAEDAGGPTGPAAEQLRVKGRALTRGLVMVSRAEAEEAIGEGAATSASGVHPVFRTDDGALIAVLPEVRVEAAAERLTAIGDRPGAHVTERNEDRVVLRPDSGRGEDALTLANEIVESGAADISQPRFVRVVDRPGPRR